ncbi:DivIVA domain-containing protein [Actinotignum sp. GS-2025f]|uniref:DivIVA domain repeat protein n=1 Tax=Actinotignum schaalii FB123-CNA-2 TaxID=883067 RepID=S2VHL6_9ACTO|nr:MULTISPECIES: DivIVA domain-containing protein [Actinotignum]EPD26933.1 DivIVA domain repeat protein [Actinotignum schaalii FB123-CNA-2]MDK7196947.1 DivIVA domain-containing protein [Actinotignum sanguinis]MDY5126923.1 DivIVA domain-containing protein [Actinotignum sp. SLA_B059]
MSTFKRVGPLTRGYNTEQVDDFLARAKDAYSRGTGDMDETDVRRAGFSRQRGGYDPARVDAALDRLEAAFIHLKRANTIGARGEQAWLNLAYQDAKSLYPRLLRPAGQRFADAEGWGYRKSDVDELLDRLARYFDGEETITSEVVRDAIFPESRGKNAYDEAVVDVFLERAVSVLLAVE